MGISESNIGIHIPSITESPKSQSVSENSSVSYQLIEGPKAIDLDEAVEFLHTDNVYFDAAETGDHVLLQSIIKENKIDIYQLNQLGRSALHLVVCSDNVYAVKLLLDSGLSPNAKDHMGMTPLSMCLLMKPSLRIAKLLFDYGATIQERIGPMDTGLFLEFITFHNTPTPEQEKIIELLVQKGALVNDSFAPGGRQALHIAAMGNNCQLIKILVHLGAKMNARNHRGETPKEFAMLFKCREAVTLLEQLEELEDSPIKKYRNSIKDT